jgi:hypothetical protein
VMSKASSENCGDNAQGISTHPRNHFTRLARSRMCAEPLDAP